MKNYWIRLYEDKRKKIWTVEFSKNGIYSLKPRRVEFFDHHVLACSKGQISVIFKDAMFASNDKELMDFLSNSNYHGITGGVSRLRIYQGIEGELENYELTGLSYDNISSGPSFDDIKYTYSFKNIRCVRVAQI